MTINNKDATLFIYSELSFEYIWLRNIILIKSYYCLQQEILRNEWTQIHFQCQKEWKALYENMDEVPKGKCELCGTSYKKPYKIKNEKNGKILIVGSTCIQHFTGIINNSKDDRKNAEAKLNELKNRQFIVENINGFEDNTKRIKTIEEDKSIFLNETLLNEKNEITQLLYQEFSSKLKKDKKFLNIENLKKINKRMISFFDNVQKQVKYCNDGGIFKINSLISKSLHTINDDKILKALRKNNGITTNTISYIEEPTFISKMIDKLRECPELSHVEIIFETIEFKELGIIFKEKNRVEYRVKTKDMLDIFKEYLFNGDSNLMKNKEGEFLNKSVISKNSLTLALSIIFDNYGNHDLEELICDEKSNLLIYFDRKKNRIFKLNLKEFVQYYKIDVYENRHGKNIINQIEDNENKLTYSELRNILKQKGYSDETINDIFTMIKQEMKDKK